MAESQPCVITIDGPSGSGKGSLASRIAGQLGFYLLDSGAVYRLAALQALGKNVDLSDVDAVLAAIEKLDIRFETGAESITPFLDNIDVSKQIRFETIADAASLIAAYPAVRARLLAVQQKSRQAPGLVADGRDMGTVVFPEAQIKFFLYAAAEIRAQRRYQQLISIGVSANITQLESEINQRDQRDRERPDSPLIPATDALVVDSSLLDLEQVTELMMDHINSILM